MYTYHAKSINNTRKNIIRNLVKCEFNDKKKHIVKIPDNLTYILVNSLADI